MTPTTLKRALATVAVAAGLIAYNGHAGLGIQDGTSNTLMGAATHASGLILMADNGGQVRGPARY